LLILICFVACLIIAKRTPPCGLRGKHPYIILGLVQSFVALILKQIVSCTHAATSLNKRHASCICAAIFLNKRHMPVASLGGVSGWAADVSSPAQRHAANQRSVTQPISDRSRSQSAIGHAANQRSVTQPISDRSRSQSAIAYACLLRS
jgi:galactokinase